MLASPLFYSKLMGVTIDLSQLVEVCDAFFSDELEGTRGAKVGFGYRYASSPDRLFYMRDLIRGPNRNPDLTLADPSKIMDTACEEQFYIKAELDADGKYVKRGAMMVLYEEDNPTKPVALTVMEAQVEILREAWLRWKQAEPEIYAIIRKHLS